MRSVDSLLCFLAEELGELPGTMRSFGRTLKSDGLLTKGARRGRSNLPATAATATTVLLAFGAASVMPRWMGLPRAAPLARRPMRLNAVIRMTTDEAGVGRACTQTIDGLPEAMRAGALGGTVQAAIRRAQMGEPHAVEAMTFMRRLNALSASLDLTVLPPAGMQAASTTLYFTDPEDDERLARLYAGPFGADRVARDHFATETNLSCRIPGLVLDRVGCFLGPPLDPSPALDPAALALGEALKAHPEMEAR